MKKVDGGKIFAAMWLTVGYVAIVLFLCLGKNYIDADMASEIILAKLCASEHNWLSTNWYYSTELRLLNQQAVMIPVSMFFSDFSTIRVLSSAIIYIITVCSFGYCCKQAGVFDKAIYFAPILVTPYTYSYMKYDLLGLYYYSYSIVAFLSVGFVIKINRDDVKKTAKIVPWIAYLVLALLIGMTTIRELIVLYYPLVMAIGILWIRDYFKRFGVKIISLTRIWNEIVLVWYKDKYLKYLLTAGIGAFVASVGYVINVVILRDIYNFHSYDRLLFTDLNDYTALMEKLMGHLKIFGYQSDVQFLSVSGITNILSLFILGCIVFIIVRIVKKIDEYDIRSGVIVVYFICAAAFNAFVLIFSNLYGERYMLPYMLFFLVILAIYMKEFKVDVSIKKLFYVIFAVTYIVNGLVQYKNFIKEEDYQGRNFIARLLVNKGYDFGYATFWNANIFTELTDGAVEVRNIQPQEIATLGYEHWLMKKSNEHRRSDKPIFIILDYEQYANNMDLEFLQLEYRVFDGCGYMIFEYANSDELYSMVQVEEQE